MVSFSKKEQPQLTMLKIAWKNSGLDMSFANFIRFMAVEFCLRIGEAARAESGVDEILKAELEGGKDNVPSEDTATGSTDSSD
jgi:hypothetical protein